MDAKTVPVEDTGSPHSVVIDVGEVAMPPPQEEKARWGSCSISRFLETRWLLHGVKLGLALVLVSLVYMVEVVHDRLGDNAMWAVMTVVVVFEFTAGGTINKGLNRGAGTIVGGGLGTMVALLAQVVDGVGTPIVVGTSLFVFGTAATYTRMIPTIKKKYDYGLLIFILTFSLIAISGVRIDEIVTVASDRLSSITIGFAICVFTSLFLFPVWAGDELHKSFTSKFNILACSIDECFEDCIKPIDEKLGTQTMNNTSCWCTLLFSSKSTDEALANFAKWEPWHGRFGFYYPWNRYLQISEQLRDLTTCILSLKGCLQPLEQHSSLCLKMSVKEQYEVTCKFLVCTLRELMNNIKGMKKGRPLEVLITDFQIVRSELCSAIPVSTSTTISDQNIYNTGSGISASIAIILVEILDKVEELVMEVEELGKAAGFACK